MVFYLKRLRKKNMEERNFSRSASQESDNENQASDWDCLGNTPVVSRACVVYNSNNYGLWYL